MILIVYFKVLNISKIVASLYLTFKTVGSFLEHILSVSCLQKLINSILIIKISKNKNTKFILNEIV